MVLGDLVRILEIALQILNAPANLSDGIILDPVLLLPDWLEVGVSERGVIATELLPGLEPGSD